MIRRWHMAYCETSADGSFDMSAFLDRVAAADRQPFHAVPPLAAEPDSVYGALMASLGGAVADLGVTDHQVDLLHAVAATVTDLGLGGGETEEIG